MDGGAAGEHGAGRVQRTEDAVPVGGLPGPGPRILQGESKEAQAQALEADLEKIRAKNGAVPPGYHAQLGLLYSSIGKDDQMVREFETEKALFPESATYMDFLLNNARGGAR